MERTAGTARGTMYSSKKCPECYTYIPLNTHKCPHCKARVGNIDDHGMAKRITNWKGNIICIFAWLILAVFVKKVFF